MRNFIVRKKLIILLLLIMLAAGNFAATFAYWANSILGDDEIATSQVDLGQWLDGIQIWTTDDFIEMITTDNNTNTYTLATDLDFNNITPATWTQTKDITFNGSFNALNHKISNISLDDYRGIFGILEDATVINLVLDSVDIDYTVNDNYTSGILAGRLQGTNNLIDNITIINSEIDNDNVLAGGLIGYASPLSGTGSATISNINILDTTISGGFDNASYGNGGLISTVNNFNLTLENIQMDVDITSINDSHAGGLIGSVIGSTVLDVNQVTISDSIIETLGTDTSLGAGGAIGFLQSTGHQLENMTVEQSQISSASLSGGLIGHVDQSSGTLSIDHINIDGVDVTSSTSNTNGGAGGLIGVIDGSTTQITNTTIDANVLSTGSAHAGGISAVVTDTSEISLDTIDINDASISITGIGTTLGAGGAIGLLNGTDHTFNQVYVNDTSITSTSLSGGLIGYADGNADSFSATVIDISNTNISTTLSDTDAGTGGLIGVLNGYTTDLDQVSIQAVVTSTNDAYAGGLIGISTTTSSLSIDDTNVTSSTITSGTTSDTLAVGGFVGLLQGSSHTLTNITLSQSTVNSIARTGGIIGYASQASGQLDINGVDVLNSNISSSVSGITTGVGGVIGFSDQYQISISDAQISSSISSTASNAGGIFGYVNATSIIDLSDITITGATINSDATSGSNGSGGLIGLLYGDGHQISNVSVINSTLTSDTSVGGIIGRSESKDSLVTISQVNVSNNQISSTLTSGTSGAGGLIGRNRFYTFDISDIYVDSSISVARSNIGGLIGFSRYGEFTFNRIVIFADFSIYNAGTTNNRGAGGLIGRNRDVTSSTVNDVFVTGYFQAKITGSDTVVGILVSTNDNLNFTNVRSAEISYELTSGETLVTSETLYDQMLGQNPTYASTYTTYRSSLTNAYWTSNFQNITNSSLWSYNAATHLYELG